MNDYLHYCDVIPLSKTDEEPDPLLLVVYLLWLACCFQIPGRAPEHKDGSETRTERHCFQTLDTLAGLAHVYNTHILDHLVMQVSFN